MVRVFAKLLRRARLQRVFDNKHRLAASKPATVGDAEDVRIDGDHGFSEGDVKHHIRRFASHARKGF